MQLLKYTAESPDQAPWQNQNIIKTDPERALGDEGFRRGPAAKSIRPDIARGDASLKTLENIKIGSNMCGSKSPHSVTIQEMFNECTAERNEVHRNRVTSPWQLLLGKIPSDNSICEKPDLAQCCVAVVDEAAKQLLREKEESYKAYLEEDLSHRKTTQKNASSPTLEALGSTSMVLVLGIWQTMPPESKEVCSLVQPSR